MTAAKQPCAECGHPAWGHTRCRSCREGAQLAQGRLDEQRHPGYARRNKCRGCAKPVLYPGRCYRCSTGQEPRIVPLFERGGAAA